MARPSARACDGAAQRAGTALDADHRRHDDLESMADKITDYTKIVYIANPDNPMGTYITDKEFDEFETQNLAYRKDMSEVLTALSHQLDEGWRMALPESQK